MCKVYFSTDAYIIPLFFGNCNNFLNIILNFLFIKYKKIPLGKRGENFGVLYELKMEARDGVEPPTVAYETTMIPFHHLAIKWC